MFGKIIEGFLSVSCTEIFTKKGIKNFFGYGLFAEQVRLLEFKRRWRFERVWRARK